MKELWKSIHVWQS